VNDNPLMSVEAVIKYLGISSATLARMRRDNTGIPYVKIGRRVFYRQADVEAFIDSNKVLGDTNE
jgi:excisionase family DNA binding protein